MRSSVRACFVGLSASIFCLISPRESRVVDVGSRPGGGYSYYRRAGPGLQGKSTYHRNKMVVKSLARLSGPRCGEAGGGREVRWPCGRPAPQFPAPKPARLSRRPEGRAADHVEVFDSRWGRQLHKSTKYKVRSQKYGVRAVASGRDAGQTDEALPGGQHEAELAGQCNGDRLTFQSSRLERPLADRKHRLLLQPVDFVEWRRHLSRDHGATYVNNDLHVQRTGNAVLDSFGRIDRHRHLVDRRTIQAGRVEGKRSGAIPGTVLSWPYTPAGATSSNRLMKAQTNFVTIEDLSLRASYGEKPIIHGGTATAQRHSREVRGT